MTDFGRRAGIGDMLKATYDANEDGIVDSVIGHKLSHQLTGSDQISVAGLLGELAAAQPSTWAKVTDKPTTFTPSGHKTSHQDGGTDEIDCAGLAGKINLVDRGDPSADDFTTTYFTTDGTWNDLDLSSIVDVGTKAVILRVVLKDDAIGSYIAFRKKGNTNNFNNALVTTQVVDMIFRAQVTVFCDASRVIEYVTTNTTFTNILLTVNGWFL